jgi:hypothetical protein
MFITHLSIIERHIEVSRGRIIAINLQFKDMARPRSRVDRRTGDREVRNKTINGIALIQIKRMVWPIDVVVDRCVRLRQITRRVLPSTF